MSVEKMDTRLSNRFYSGMYGKKQILRIFEFFWVSNFKLADYRVV